MHVFSLVFAFFFVGLRGAFGPQCYGGRWGALIKALLMKLLRERLDLDTIESPVLHGWILLRERTVGPGQGFPVWISIYIDDLMAVCAGWEVAYRVQTVIREWEQLSGVEQSWEKHDSEGLPSERLNMIGIDFETDTMTKRYPEDKRRHLMEQLTQALAAEWLRERELLSFFMQILWMESVMYARYHLKHGGLRSHAEDTCTVSEFASLRSSGAT